MKLITELTEEVEYITEADASGEKSHYITGIFLQGNLKNRNGRVYPMDILEAEVDRYNAEKVAHGRSYGELGHPAGPAINLHLVSHIITELKRDGNNFIGKAKLTETPMGDIARGLLKSGAGLGVSSRGLGTLKTASEGFMEVQADFRLATAGDIVADPSAPDAFVNGILENVDWVYNASLNSYHQEQLEDTRKALKKMTMDDIEKSKFGIFENFMTKLSKF